MVVFPVSRAVTVGACSPIAYLTPVIAIEDPVSDGGAHAIDPFYASLARTLRKENGAVTRVLHYGD